MCFIDRLPDVLRQKNQLFSQKQKHSVIKQHVSDNITFLSYIPDLQPQIACV